jgi:FkbM family methyltransferase
MSLHLCRANSLYTRALFEKGFSGVMVEPSPACFKRIEAVYGSEPRIQLVNKAIAEKDGHIAFHDCSGDAIGTTNIPHKEKWERGAGVKYNDITVETMSMNKLIDEFGSDVDFLSLDTEGTNLELFNLLPDSFLSRLKMICIEHDNYNMQIEQKLNGFGFRTLHLNGENLIMVK